MKICVFGLWHLGLVTAACLADKGFNVVGLDQNKIEIEKLNKGIIPLEEPNLKELTLKGIRNKKLSFTDSICDAMRNTEILWITIDTPVDKNDIADTNYVMCETINTFPYISSGTTILISSQLPVGSTLQLQEIFELEHTDKSDVNFAYSPENLRHGRAIEIFNNPGRIIVGAKDENNMSLKILLRTICQNTIYMSLESAEMVKHTLNAFLATEIAFINEISLICEKTGANIKDVEKGLMSDSRIGDKGFLKAGKHYTGGTLGRDVEYLHQMSNSLDLKSSLIRAISESNYNHKKY